MLMVGLTGGIGAGKSTVAALLTHTVERFVDQLAEANGYRAGLARYGPTSAGHHRPRHRRARLVTTLVALAE
jgi:adenylylsulfate kinase-like enzyme